MRSLNLLILLLLLFMCSYGKPPENSKATSVSSSENGVNLNGFKYWTWITAKAGKSNAVYRKEFTQYKENGIDAVIINTGTDQSVLAGLVPLLKRPVLKYMRGCLP